MMKSLTSWLSHSPSPPLKGGGRLLVHEIRGVHDPFDAATLYHDALLVFRKCRQKRIKDFLLETARKPGGIYGHISIYVSRQSLVTDDFDNYGDLAAKCIRDLVRFIQDDFKGNLYTGDVRIVIMGHDLDADLVMIKAGRAQHIPAVTDQPVAEIEIDYRDQYGKLHRRMLDGFRFYSGQPGRLLAIDKRFAIYPGMHSLLFSTQLEAGVTLIPGGNIEGMPYRIGIDLDKYIGMIEADDKSMPEYEPLKGDGEGLYQLVIRKPGLPPPGEEPEALIFRITPCVHAAAEKPAPVSADQTKKTPTKTKDSAETLVGGRRRPDSTPKFGLEVVGICIQPVLEDSDFLSYTITLGRDGSISPTGQEGTQLAVSTQRSGVDYAVDGGDRWLPLSVPGTIPLPAGGLAQIVSAPPGLENHCLAIFPLRSGSKKCVLSSNRHVIGRPGGQHDKDKIHFDMLLALTLKCKNSTVKAVEQFGLSRDHCTVEIIEGSLHLKMLNGQTDISVLDADLKVLSTLQVGSKNSVILQPGSHFVVGPYMIRLMKE